ncbi:MAG: XTP/dITP diphosphatase [Culicoidibacterales bacterium]
MKILLASNNAGKVKEFQEMFAPLGHEIISLAEADIVIDVEETGTTYFENAYLKAKAIFDLTQMPTLADDSGLSVLALHGKPGVYSARYAGKNATDAENNTRLLKEMLNVPDTKRGAAFVCELVFIAADLPEGVPYLHTAGQVVGEITHEGRGTNGFGYNPVVYYPPFEKTFAEMSSEEKNKISHRSEALKRMVNKLEEVYGK